MMKKTIAYLLILLVLSPVSTSLASSLKEDLAALRAASRGGKPQEARLLADKLLHRYPQDYRVVLAGAWSAFEGKDYPRALRLYRRASDLSEGSFDTRLGIAWSLLRLRRRKDALFLFRALVKIDASNASAKKGLEEAEKEDRLWIIPVISLGVQAYDKHPSKRWAATSLFGLLVTRSVWWIDASYRYSHYFVKDLTTLQSSQAALGGGPGGRGGGYPPPPYPPPPYPPGSGYASSSSDGGGFAMHEAFLLGGYDGKRAGFSLAYAYVFDGSGYFGSIHVGGAKVRWSPLGDICLAGSLSAYSDLNVFGGRLSWKLPLKHLYVTPAVHIQGGQRKIYASGSLSLGLQWRWLHFEVGGTYGESLRPVDFDRLTIYSIPEIITYGGRAGFGIHLGRVGLTLSYAADRLVDTSNRKSIGHYVNLSLNVVTGRF